MNKDTAIKSNNIVDPKDIKNAISAIGKNWYWFVIFIALGVSASLFQYYRTSPIFGASAKILIKPQKNAFQDALTSALPLGPNKEDIANEITILSSRKLISETVTKLNLDVSYFIKGRLKTGEVYGYTPFSVEGKILDDNFYGIPFYLRILNKDSYSLEIKSGTYNYSKTLKFGDPVVTNKFSLIVTGKESSIANNPHLLESQYIFILNNHGYLVRQYQKALTLEKDPEASVINASIEDQVPEKAVDFLDTLTNLYINYSVAVAKGINDNSLKFIDGELKEVEEELNGVETNLVQYQQNSGAIDVANQQGAYLKEKMDVEGAKAKLTVQLSSVDYLYNQLGNEGGELSTISPSILSDQSNPALMSSFNELTILLQRKANLAFSNTENSPVMKEVEEQIAKAKERVIAMIVNIRKSLVMQINALSSREGAFSGAISSLPSKIKGLTDITRKKDINEKMYLYLLETRAQNVIAKAAIVPDKSIIEPSGYTGLLRPIKAKSILMGVGAGLALTLLIIFLKSVFLNYVYTKDELAAITNQPIIGVVGKTAEAKKDYLAVHANPQSLTAEAFRVIRTNLSYFAPKSASKIILFTSSISKEGKSFCAISTGTTLARAKNKVVVVDLDLHKPKQATAFNLTNDVGATSYIVGKANLSQIIKDTPIENLKVILSGPKSPNASELILDSNLEQMLNELRQSFDYIILDTPPVGLISDALALMKHSDLNIYVLKAAYSKKEFVDIAHNIMEKNNIKSLSFILNGVSSKNIPVGYGGSYYK
jgi:capsular exopolysaccharide synthesis family protein